MATLGIEAKAEDPVEALSLGNQQRVQLAVALVHEPDLLVLDEPFSGLDPDGVDALSRALAEEIRERGVPVIFSSHQLELVERLCDAVSIVKDGRLVASGEVADLRARRGGRRLQVEVEGAPEMWWKDVPGVGDWTTDGDTVLLTLEPGADDQRVLAAATAAGRVRRFGYTRLALAEIFREAVAA